MHKFLETHRHAKWLPAFAGMTALQEHFKQQVTPVPVRPAKADLLYLL